MAKDPAVLLYTSDFLSGVSFFTMEERGQYITLLCLQHQKNTIPENHMISICKSLDSPVALKFIKDTNGEYFNERMRSEAISRKNYCESRSNNKSGRPKKNHTEIIRKSYDSDMNIHMEDEDINKDKGVNNINTNRRKFDYKQWFERAWKQYPQKDGKIAASKHYEKTVKTIEDHARLMKGLKNYMAYVEHKRKHGQKDLQWKNGSTWFYNWEDWPENDIVAEVKPKWDKNKGLEF